MSQNLGRSMLFCMIQNLGTNMLSPITLNLGRSMLSYMTKYLGKSMLSCKIQNLDRSMWSSNLRIWVQECYSLFIYEFYSLQFIIKFAFQIFLFPISPPKKFKFLLNENSKKRKLIQISIFHFQKKKKGEKKKNLRNFIWKKEIKIFYNVPFCFLWVFDVING